MRAILLAAGEGTRLRPYTSDRPKCLVELAGKALLAHQREALEAAGVEDITVVTGYRAERIRELGYRTLHNEAFASTNMVASLLCAAELLDGTADVLVAYADIVYEPRIVRAIASCEAPISTTVDTSWQRLWRLRMEDILADAETLKMNSSGDIRELGRRPGSLEEVQGQYMGLIKMRASFAPQAVSIYRQMAGLHQRGGPDPSRMYMTTYLQHLIDQGQPVRAVVVDGGWLEVDTAADLELFARLSEAGRLSEYWQPGAAEESDDQVAFRISRPGLERGSAV